MKRLIPLLLLIATNTNAAIRGVVYDDHGVPVAHARVEAARAETQDTLRARLVAGNIERKPLATATTEDDGTFTLDVKAVGVVQLLATIDGGFPAITSAMSDATGVALMLPPSRTRSGKVTCAGKPVANALVAVLAGPTLATTVRTNESGAFTLPLADTPDTFVAVIHPNFAPELRILNPNGSLDFALDTGKHIAGRVLGADDKPVPGATLLTEQWPLGKTDAEGNFVVEHAITTLPLRAVRGSDAGVFHEGTIRLEPKPAVTGTVTGPDNKPISGAIVKASTTTERDAVTDDKGQYRLDTLDRAIYQMMAFVPGLQFDEAGADVRRAQLARTDFRGTPQVAVRGTVRNDQGKPVGGARVIVDREGAPVASAVIADSAYGLTTADGRFSIPLSDLLGWQSLRVTAIHPRYAMASKPVELRDKLPLPVDLTVTAGVELKGRVVAADGQPVAGAGIMVLEAEEREGTLPYEEMLESGYAHPLFESAADGTFAIPAKRGVKYDIAVWKTGYTGRHEGDVEPGGRELRLVLEPGVEVRGRVVRKDSSAPIVGSISLLGENNLVRERELTGDGRFVFDSIRPGKYRLSVITPQAERAKMLVDAPADNVTLELPPAGEVHATVIDKETGKPLEDASAYLMREADDEGAALEAHGDSFSFVTTAGPIQLRVSAPGYLTESLDVVVDPKKTTEVRAALMRGRTLHGRVTNVAGLPLDEVSVSGDEVPDVVQTNANGEYEMDGLPPGALTLSFSRAGYRTRTLTTPANPGPALDVVLASGRTARGRVVSTNGEGVAEANVYVKSPASYTDARQATTEADGTFVVEGLPEGHLTFEVLKDTLRATREDVDIDAGPVVLTLKPEATAVLHGTVTGTRRGDWYNISVYARAGKDNVAMAPVNRDGTWRMEDAPSGDVRVSATASTANRQITTPQKILSLAPGDDLEVNLAFGTITVRGTVTEHGQPSVMRGMLFLSKTRADFSSWRTTTNTNGGYEVASLEPGTYEVHVYLDGAMHYERDYDVTGSATLDIDIDTTTIQGRVVDERGLPVTDAQVTVGRPGSTDDYTYGVNTSGGFSVNVVTGTWTVTATAKGFAAATQTVEAGASPVVLQLTRTGGVKVRLVDGRDGHLIEGYVAASGSSGAPLRVRDHDADGTYTLPLHPGTYRISASAFGYGSASRTIAENEPMPIVFALMPGGTLVVRGSGELLKLVRPDGSDYVACECNGESIIRLQGATTTLEHVAAGNYVLQLLDAQGHVRSSQPVTIQEGQTTSVELHAGP